MMNDPPFGSFPMIVRRVLALALALSLPVAALATDAPARHDVSVLHCARLLDTAAGKMLGETTVIVDTGRIKELRAGSVDIAPYKDAAARAGGSFQYVDLPDATCLPGLIDSHTHLTFETSPTGYTDQFHWNTADYAIRSTVYARRTLLAGFTTVRNLADGNNESDRKSTRL